MNIRLSSLNCRAFLVVVVALLANLGFACSSSDDKAGTIAGQPDLTVNASPLTLAADGSLSTISIHALESPGTAGAGTVHIEASRGSMNAAGATADVTLAGGNAEVTYSCSASSDPACVGAQTVLVTWKSITRLVSIQFTSTGVPDGGTDGGADADASMDVQETGAPDAPDEVAPDGPDDVAEVGVAHLTLTAVDTQMFSDVGDHAVLRAVLTDGMGGAPMSGQEIVFSTGKGLLENPVGPPPDPNATMALTTNAAGEAEVWFADNGAKGFVTIKATHTASGQTAEAIVEILTVQQVSHVSTTCSGQACTIMGIKGSGFNEQAQVTFLVVDSKNDPAEGVTVEFAIANPPTGTTVTPSGKTNAQGKVTANVSSGKSIGAFSVKAVAIPGLVEAESPTIGIRGAKTANEGFSLKCSPVNVGAYASATPPAPYNINCDVKLVDRYNNPVGTGTSVNFKAEAGSIPNSIGTTAYQPSGTNTNEGTGLVVFSTVGTWPARDVAPLAAAPLQWPNPRDAEPSVQDGGILRNPRDGLVTIIAYVRGEEAFQDDNNNGTWDVGERFIDQGEPFVDADDNGVRDAGEVYIDEAPADGQWNPANGQWDQDTSIWVEARVLYTGRPGALSHLEPFPGETLPYYVLHGATVGLSAFFPDLNYNRPQASGTTFLASHTATKGSVLWKSSALLDDYGFMTDRFLMDTTSHQACSAASQICEWTTQFYTWGHGYCGYVDITGTSLNDTTPSQLDLLSVDATVLSTKYTIQASGEIQ